MYIVVAGGGMVGGGLVRSLLDNKHDVVLIEQHKELCDKLYAETGVVAITGGATSIQALTEAGIRKADVVVAATGSDADNLACAILAKSFDVTRVIVRMRDPAYKNAYIVAGVHSIVRVTDLMVNQMMMDIENPEVRRITTIGGKSRRQEHQGHCRQPSLLVRVHFYRCLRPKNRAILHPQRHANNQRGQRIVPDLRRREHKKSRGLPNRKKEKLIL